MRNYGTRGFLALAAALGAGTALAHSGHGHTPGNSWTHVLTEPAHWAPWAAAALIVFGALGFWRLRARAGR